MYVFHPSFFTQDPIARPEGSGTFLYVSVCFFMDVTFCLTTITYVDT
jgi:hypothetical protein